MRIIKIKSLPTPLTLIMVAIVLAAAATWLLPSGQYDKLSAETDTAFKITSGSEVITLPFTQHTLDSLAIKISLQK